MPRQTQKRMKGATQISPQETFDFTVPARQVSARDVDTRAAVPQADAKVTGILTFIDQMKSGLKTAVQIADIRSKEKREEGYRAGAKGEKVEAPRHWAFIEGYEQFKGEAAGKDYYAQIDALFQKAGDLEPSDWDQQRDKITESFLFGSSDAFIDGFVPKAMIIEEHYDKKYHGVLQERIKNDYLTTVRGMADFELTTIYNSTMSTAERAKAVRDSLSKEQARSKGLGIAGRTEISNEFVETFIEKATTLGRPDFLDGFFEPDESGMKLSSRPELADKLWAGLRQANSRKAAKEDKVVENYNKVQKEAIEDIERTIVWSMENDDPVGAAEKIMKYAGIIDSEHLQKYLKRNNELSLEANFAKVIDVEWHRAADKKAILGQMTDADWAEANKHLTRPAYIALAKINNKGGEELAKDKWGMHSTFDRKKKELIDVMCARDIITGVIADPLEQQRAMYISDQLDMLYFDFVKKSGVEALSVRQIMDWRTEIAKDAIEKFGKVIDVRSQMAAKVQKKKGGGSAAAETSVVQPEEVELHLTDRLDNLTYHQSITNKPDKE